MSVSFIDNGEVGFKSLGGLKEGDPVFIMGQDIHNWNEYGRWEVKKVINFIYRGEVYSNLVPDHNAGLNGTIWILIYGSETKDEVTLSRMRFDYKESFSEVVSCYKDFSVGNFRRYYTMSGNALRFKSEIRKMMEDKRAFDPESYTRLHLAANRIKDMVNDHYNRTVWWDVPAFFIK